MAFTALSRSVFAETGADVLAVLNEGEPVVSAGLLSQEASRAEQLDDGARVYENSCSD